MTAQPDEGFGIAPPGRRLPADLRLGPVTLQVADLDRSIDWYRAALGLAPLELGTGVVQVGAGAPLVKLRERRGARPPEGRLGLYHFALLLPDRRDLGRLIRHLHARGIPFGASDHEVSEAVYLRDPDGLGIEVYADRPRASWRSRPTPRGRELVMATKPLDLDDLVASAAGPPWTAMPEGTMMGHLHLHVGDLERARTFYHLELGLDEVVWTYPGALFLSAGGYHHHLGLNTWAGPEATAPPETEARLEEWTLCVSDRVLAVLGPGGTGPGRQGSDRLMTDPWGTVLRLMPTS